MKKNDLAAFEDRKIRRVWVEKEEKWYFSVIDVIEILSESNLPKRYWSDLKKKLRNEGFVQVYDKIVRFKLESIDKKIRETD